MSVSFKGTVKNGVVVLASDAKLPDGTSVEVIPEEQQSAMAKAQRIAQEELDALGWAAPDLQGRRKSDPQKVGLAAR